MLLYLFLFIQNEIPAFIVKFYFCYWRKALIIVCNFLLYVFDEFILSNSFCFYFR